MREIKDEWLLDRIKSIYPAFKNGVNEIFRVQIGVVFVTRLIDGHEKTIKMEYTLNGDEKHKTAYNVSFVDNVLYIQGLRKQ